MLDRPPRTLAPAFPARPPLRGQPARRRTQRGLGSAVGTPTLRQGLSQRKEFLMASEFQSDRDERPETGSVGAKRMSLGLGYFSIGLGLAEIAAARPIARWLGLGNSKAARNTLVAFGIREIAA